MKVAHLIESTGFYGAERVVINLCTELQSASSYQPLVLGIVKRSGASPKLLDVARDRGIDSSIAVVRNWLLPIDALLLCRKVVELKVDILHCHGYKAAILGRLVKRVCGVRCVTTCHLWYMGRTRPFRSRFLIAVEKWLHRSADVVVAVSQKIKDSLVAVGVDADRVEVVPNGIPLTEYKKSSVGSNTYDRNHLRILNVGRLSEQKAQSALIECARILRERGTVFEINIVGEGPFRPALEAQIAREGLGDSVNLLGFRDDVVDLLQQSDVFVLPSYDEGMPMALLEAAAVCLPIIATDVGDVGKVVVNDKSGQIIDAGNAEQLADAIAVIASDWGKADQQAQVAHDRVRSFYSSQNMCVEYSRIYSLLKGQ